MAKVIHVHLLNRGRYERKDYYFSSISAVYTVLTPEDVGVTKSYLLHAGLSGNGSVSGNSLWNEKKGTKATVIVDGVTVKSAS